MIQNSVIDLFVGGLIPLIGLIYLKWINSKGQYNYDYLAEFPDSDIFFF